MIDFEYIRSRGAHGHHAFGSFDAFVGCEREIWIGSDGSGLIRECRGSVSFFTEAGRAGWQAAGSPELVGGPSIDLFAPGILGGDRMGRARLDRDPERLETALRKHATTPKDVQELLGEAVVGAEFCQLVYDLARELPGVKAVPELSDQLGRVGRGLVGVQLGERIELIFATDCSELLGYQWFLAEPQPFAPGGTLHSWSAFVQRTVVDRLPADVPPSHGCRPGLPAQDECSRSVPASMSSPAPSTRRRRSSRSSAVKGSSATASTRAQSATQAAADAVSAGHLLCCRIVAPAATRSSLPL